MLGQAAGGAFSVAGGGGVENGPVLDLAVLPLAERAKTQAVALGMVGQLADFSDQARAGSCDVALVERPMRLAQISQEFEVYARFDGVDTAVSVVAARRGKSYDPGLADVVCAEGPRVWAEVGELDPWDEAMSRAPSGLSLDAVAAHECLLVLADFADLKSPWTNGHSRAVAELVGEVCGADAAAAALLHDLGRVAVSNTVWDKAGKLTRDERDRVESHTLVTDQLLRRLRFSTRASSSDMTNGLVR